MVRSEKPATNEYSIESDYNSGCDSLSNKDALQWARDDEWEPAVAICLLSGVKPEFLINHGLGYTGLASADQLNDLDPACAKNRILEIHRASTRSNQFHESRQPIQYLIWGNRLGLPMPTELVEHVTRITEDMPVWKRPLSADKAHDDATKPRWIYDGSQRCLNSLEPANTKPTNDDRPLHAKRTTSMRKLILAMAYDQYGYSPNNMRNPTGRIMSAIDRAGLTIDQSVIKSILDECFLELDPDLSVKKDAC